MRARRALRGVGALAFACLLAACAGPAPATSLNPLFRGESGSGHYEHDLPVPGPLRGTSCPPPAPSGIDLPGQPCRHAFGPHGTHTYVDPLTGMPALCAIVRCTKCGEIRHECGLGRR